MNFKARLLQKKVPNMSLIKEPSGICHGDAKIKKFMHNAGFSTISDPFEQNESTSSALRKSISKVTKEI